MSFFTNKSILFPILALTLITLAVVSPMFFDTSAARVSSEPGSPRFGYYDIRTDKRAVLQIAEYRNSASRNAAEVADIRDGFVRGEELLKAKVPTLKVEYNTDLRIPEVIAPDIKQGKAFLTSSASADQTDILTEFLNDNNSLVGVTEAQISELKVVADYKNPENDLAFVEMAQEIDGVPVFRGEVKAGFTKKNEIIRVINNLAPGLNQQNISKEFGDPLSAVKAAADSIEHPLNENETTINSRESTPVKAVFGNGDFAVTAEKIYFPTEPGVAIPAWRVLIWQPVNAYYVIVDANSGTMLWRKNISDDQTTSATYRVYANPNAMVQVADNPFPMTPGPTSPNGVQGSPISRTAITRIGNEAPYTFNDLGWITDGNNTTDGNNVEAGLDRELPNPASGVGIDPNGKATGNPNRVFDFPINPGVPTNPASGSGDAPLPAGQVPATCQAQGTATAPTDYQKAFVTHLFYITNWYHDETYRLGFTEQARNFQNNNFGRGGTGSDRVSAEAQDCNGSNNANFSTPADGGRGRMQMFLWTAPTPDVDGSLDADIVIHELTHGLSNRLHGNAAGLGGLNMSRAMGEGWSDFYAHAMLSETTDPINGIYPTGGYAKYGSVANFNNYYYGVRRFPKAVIAFTGSNGRPHNPMTFNDIDSTKINLTDGAFAPAFSTTPDGVHAGGEIWSSTLWEVRAKYITRLGWADGNRRVLQHITDGMKLAPLTPTFLQERDAIIAGVLGTGTAADAADIWAGFALRGMGFSASIQNTGGSDINGAGTGLTRVTEAFDLPNLIQTPEISVNDLPGDNDGFFEPGETVNILVPLRNITGTSATGVTIQLTGGTSANYGTILHAETRTETVQFTIPANAGCGSALTLSFSVNSSLGVVSFQRVIRIGQPITTFTENFDGVSAPAFPAGWTATPISNGINFVTAAFNSNSGPNAAFALNPSTVGGGTELVSPAMAISVPAAVMRFRNRFDTEAGWDGGTLEISINGGAFQDILTAGGMFIENGYNGPLGAGTNNPVANRNAWSGNSNGYITTRVQLPSTALGQNVQFKFKFGSDNNTTGTGPNPGWYIDDVQVAGQAACSFTATNQRSRADFDGDGKTDMSVYRPLNNNWYVNRSNGGIDITAWGLDNDTPVPGRYDGDNRTDIAVFRPSENRWYVLNSNGSTVTTFDWGLAGDQPVPGDYDGDGRNDPAVFRSSENKWYVQNSSGGIQVTEWGLAGDFPVTGDFDGDGKTDKAVYRTGQWFAALSGGGVLTANWGLFGDQAVPADYDGDNKDDFAVFRPTEGRWYIRRSSDGGITEHGWGLPGDIPAPGDYDGDGRDDPAVFRNGTWYLLRSNSGIYISDWGLAGDIPIPRYYLP